MKRDFFEKLECLPQNADLDLLEIINNLAYNDQGLIPVITQDANSKEVLMFAWMTKQALEHTLETGRMTYWSRSRQQLWIKGETSGAIQTVRSVAIDCDGDVILCQVDQVGGACHTGRDNCFYLHVDIEQRKVVISQDSPLSVD